MATLKEIVSYDVFNYLDETLGRPTRQENSGMANLWYVEIGEPFKLVSFSINESRKLIYIGVSENSSNEEIDKLVDDTIKLITDEDVKGWNYFLEKIDEWGCD